MTNGPQSKLVLHDRPWGLWLFGLILAGLGIVILFAPKGNVVSWLFAAIFGGIGWFTLLIGAQLLTVTADKNTNTLVLDYWAPLWRSRTTLAISEVASLQVESTQTYNSKSHTRSRVYRAVVVKRDGNVVPLRTSYSSGDRAKRQLADDISSFIGVGRVAPSSREPQDYGNELAGMPTASAETQGVLAGVPVQPQQVTEGVHWRIETTRMGTAPVTRWISPDFSSAGAFVMLSQKVGGASLNGLLGGAIGRFLTQQAMSLYGIPEALTPGIASAQAMPNLDPQLDRYYDSLTNSAELGRQLITPWVARPLVNWAVQNPAQQLQAPDRIGPLLVLFSPQGLYLMFFNMASDEQVRALTQLGVDLVRSQGTPAGPPSAW